MYSFLLDFFFTVVDNFHYLSPVSSAHYSFIREKFGQFAETHSLTFL